MDPPPGWSAKRERRALAPSYPPDDATVEGAVAAVARCAPVAAPPASSGKPPPTAPRLPAAFATVLKPAPDRGLAVLPRSARAALAAVAEPGGAPPDRILQALARLVARCGPAFGGAGGSGAGEVGGYDPRTEAALRSALAGAVAEGCEDAEFGAPLEPAPPPGPVAAVVVVPRQGVYAATATPAGCTTTTPPPAIALFDLSGALLASLPDVGTAAEHTIPGSDDDGLGAPTLTTRSSHVPLPPDGRPCAVAVASPGGGGGGGACGGAPSTGLRPADVAAHFGHRLWGLVRVEADSVAGAAREGLPLAYAASTGSVGSGQPSLVAATLVLRTAEQNTFPDSAGFGEDKDDEVPGMLGEEDPPDDPPELKEFTGAAGEPWWA